MDQIQETVETFELDIWPVEGTMSLGSNAHMKKISDWLTVSLTSTRENAIQDCMNVFDKTLDEITKAFDTLLAKKE